MAKRGRASKEEIQYVVDNYGKMTTVDICQKLERTEDFVLKVVGQKLPTPVVDDKQAEIDRLNAIIASKDAQIAASPPPINMHKVEKAGFAIRKDASGKSKGIVIGTEQAAQKADDGYVQKKTNVTLRKFSDAIHRPSQDV